MAMLWKAEKCRWMLTVIAIAIVALSTYYLLIQSPQPGLTSDSALQNIAINRTIAKVVCQGPGGSNLTNLGRAQYSPNKTYPVPTIGSFEALGLEQSWLSFDQRYGPYGYGEERSDYAFPRVDGETVDWGGLQKQCLEDNAVSSSSTTPFTVERRLRLAQDTKHERPSLSKTGRQAIVLRSWSTYNYQTEDMWNIRSLISEAALATGAEFEVILLVDVKCEECGNIHTSVEAYQEVLKASVPPEFRNMAVLFHKSIQQSWYSKVGEYKPIWQIMQPLQLFAHFYPEYDHYWQFEMDTRFLGHAGDMLRAFDAFGRAQPTKQARERASWAYMPKVHGSYEDFSADINRTLEGGAAVWGPVKVNWIKPGSKPPPEKDPKKEAFQWGVGDDADLLLFGPLNEVGRFEKNEDWVFKYWYQGSLIDKPPRFMSVPAQGRASRELLQTIHRAQHERGVAVPSEATLPSFALWTGLKVVGLPIPKFQFPERDVWELNFVQNGGFPERFKDGIASGPGKYRGSSLGFFSRPLTFDWWSTLCDATFDKWMKKPRPEPKPDHAHPEYVQVPNELPGFMVEEDGEVYVPNIMLHPRKSDHYRAPE